MVLMLSLSNNNLPWFFHSNDPSSGNYTRQLTGGIKALQVNASDYLSMELPIIVTLVPPAVPPDPSRPVDWQQIEGILCSPSGAVERSSADVDALLGRPTRK